MTRLYKIEDLPDYYFGKDYNFFNIEVANGVPLEIRLWTVDDEYIGITDVDDIRQEAPRSDEYHELKYYERWGYLSKSGKKRLVELLAENNVNDLKYQLKYQRFLWFLSSIRLVKSDFSFDEDVKFIRDNYGINMIVSEEV